MERERLEGKENKPSESPCGDGPGLPGRAGVIHVVSGAAERGSRGMGSLGLRSSPQHRAAPGKADFLVIVTKARKPRNETLKEPQCLFLQNVRANVSCCRGFKHTKDKWIQKISSLRLLEITLVLREATARLNETVPLFFFLKRQIRHVNLEVHPENGHS